MSHDDVASSVSTFEQFLKAMGPKMKRLLAANRIPTEDAEDVLQQALLALIYRWDTIRDPESWLLGTLRRHCLMYWRDQRRRLYSAVDTAILEWLSRPVAPPQERSDLLCDLRQVLERLPARCRSVLELRFQLGYEPAEVARRLGYRDSSIGKVTGRCLAALAREMLAAATAPAALASPERGLPGDPGDAGNPGERPAAISLPSGSRQADAPPPLALPRLPPGGGAERLPRRLRSERTLTTLSGVRLPRR
jgi:RNA polymerase sigma factor (sigma-70 family)